MSNLFSYAIDVPTLSALAAAGWFIWSRYQALEHRLDRIERQADKDRNGAALSRQSVQSSFDRLEYLLHGQQQALDHKARRLESGILTLSQALEKYSGGKYVPRHPTAWPTDDPPSGILQ